MNINGLGASYGSASSAMYSIVADIDLPSTTDKAKNEASTTEAASSSVQVSISETGKAASAQASQASFKDVEMNARDKLDALIQQAAKKAGISPRAVNVQAIGVIDYSGFSDQELAAMSLNSSKNFSVEERDQARGELASRMAVSLEPYRAATNAGDRRGHAMAINALYDQMSPEVRQALGWTPTMMAANNHMLAGDEAIFGKLDIFDIYANLRAAHAHGGLTFTPDSGAATVASGTTASSTQHISTLARQLAECATRAEIRDKTMTRDQLAGRAAAVIDQIFSDGNAANKASIDREVPNTSDPELLARAKAATAFVNRATHGAGLRNNPFSGLPREQLDNIIYDDSSTFTINERCAAYYEVEQQDEAWRTRICAQAMNEYNTTGKLTNFYSAALEGFNGLPAIEQAQYPKEYASKLQSWIKMDFNFWTDQAEGQRNTPKSLIEMLLGKTSQWPDFSQGGSMPK